MGDGTTSPFGFLETRLGPARAAVMEREEAVGILDHRPVPGVHLPGGVASVAHNPDGGGVSKKGAVALLGWLRPPALLALEGDIGVIGDALVLGGQGQGRVPAERHAGDDRARLELDELPLDELDELAQHLVVVGILPADPELLRSVPRSREDLPLSGRGLRKETELGLLSSGFVRHRAFSSSWERHPCSGQTGRIRFPPPHPASPGGLLWGLL